MADKLPKFYCIVPRCRKGYSSFFIGFSINDLLEHGFYAKDFAMLGLGDIVIPGIFIALMLRFDIHLHEKVKRRTNLYFNATFLAYFAGLVMTIVVVHVFKHAQPAVLYLVPACLGVPLLLALVNGDIRGMFKYEDQPTVVLKEKLQMP